MGIVDIIIIIFLLFGFLIGWKNGFTKQLVSTIGFMIVVALSYVLKNYLSSIFYTYLPFFEFGGSFKGVTSINILLYELLAFIIVFCLLMVIFKILVKATSAFEKFLKMTIILGIPSKILGGLLGILENYVVAFIALYFLSLPAFNLTMVSDSNLGRKMLNSTPLLSNICKDTLHIYDEIEDLKDAYQNEEDRKEFDKEILRILKERDVISQENIDKLVQKGKISKDIIE